MCSHVTEFNARNSKFSVGFKTTSILHQSLSELGFNGDLVYNVQKFMGRMDFSDQFRKSIIRCKRIGYNLNVMQQSACLVFKDLYSCIFNIIRSGTKHKKTY